MTDFLASVSSIEEACLLEQLGADIIDLKNPLTGALGAISADQISGIVAALNKTSVISATIGDLPLIPEVIIPAVQKTAATGVNFIKIGLFNNGNLDHCLAALQPLIIRNNLAIIGVLFADQSFDIDQIKNLATHGFKGVMLDTANKSSGSLCSLLTEQTLATFIVEAKQHDLLCGLAGSLRLSDIEPLSALNPDYLGFRGALCEKNQRTSRLNQANIMAIRRQITNSNNLISMKNTALHAI